MSKKKEEQALEKIIVPRVTRLNAAVNGIVSGIALGLLIFISTIWLVIKGGDVVGPHLALLGQFFIGYRVTIPGSFIGFGYGFLTGFLLGYGVSTLYNWILRFRGG